MAEIRLHHKHACSRPEARERLAPYIREIARAYGLRTKWIEDVCYFDGPARGYLRVMEGSILLLANFTPTVRLFRASIEQGICKTLDKALS